MPLTYVPEKRHLVSWGEPLTRALDPCPTDLASEAIRVVVPPGVVEVVRGPAYQPRLVVSFLGIATDEEIDTLEPSAAAYALASRIALDFVRRESVLPVLVGTGSETRLRWTAAPSSEDRALLAALAASFPPAAHAAAVPGAPAGYVESADVVLRAFVNDAIDSFMRATPQDSLLRRIGSAPSAPAATSHARWEERFVEAARTARPAFSPAGLTEQHVVESLGRWAEHALSAEAHFELTLKLELPAGGPLLFPLVSKITAPGDPTFSMPTAEVLRLAPGTAPVGVEKALRKGLLRAGELFPFLADRLPRLAATDLVLDADETWTFVNRGAVVPVHGGLRVELPAELKGLEKRRIETRLRVGREDERDGPGAGLSLDDLVPFEWEALLGEEPLSRKELEELAHSKGSLVRLRGQWIAVDRESLESIRERVLGKKLDTRAILRAALTGEHRDGRDDSGNGVPVEVRGALVNLLAALRDVGEDAGEPRPIKGLVAELRPYQVKGVSWLRSRAAVGAGACLADDMGLGKTLQLIAFLLARREEKPKDTRPILVVAPTSVLGNWEREINRFAPSLTVLHHYGPSRASKATALQRQSRVVFITSYGVLRRDADLLSDVDFSTVILDEAQNIKNPGSASARAARALTATHRFALTGTPVENRLTELWSILEFAMPGLLGSLQSFRRDIAGPVERRSDPMATERLRRLIGPFLLRRLKSDPLVIKDLPPKNEMTVLCSLTKEQATLYAAVVREELTRVEEAEGLARRGRILALLTALKQVCNHPVQYMRDAGPLIRRSGKLTRLLEMLEEALAEGDKVLVFTQYREMGDLLSDAIEGMLGVDTMFLHGGTPRRERERMVKTFQEDADGPRVFLLSLKAGGTGLNLTAACRVFHFDRWWNPAVEDQATDRAYRIGQTRTVQVHKLVCQGTLEEKIDALLVQKRGLADRVVGGGEEWLTELSNSELAELVSLSAGDLDLDDDEDPTASAEESDSEVAEVTVSQDMSPRAMRQKPGSRKRGSS